MPGRVTENKEKHLPEATREEFEVAKALGTEEFVKFVETHSLGEIWDQIESADDEVREALEDSSRGVR